MRAKISLSCFYKRKAANFLCWGDRIIHVCSVGQTFKVDSVFIEIRKKKPTHTLTLPISFYFHPSKLHIQRPVSALGVMGHGGAERAHSRGSHGILDDRLRSSDRWIGRGFLVFFFDIQVFRIGSVTLGCKAKMWPQLYTAKKKY